MPPMGDLKNNDIPFLSTRVLFLRLHSLESTVVRVVLVLQHLSSSTETCEVLLPLDARSPDSPNYFLWSLSGIQQHLNSQN